jgi:hypothetical protein
MSERRDNERWIDERLERERPDPEPGFLSRLEQHLLSLEAAGFARPQNLAVLIVAFALCGAALLVIALAGVLGSGPLAG